jgi:hypothetical protein
MWKKNFKKIALLVTLTLSLSFVTTAQHVISVGPMIHVNFGSGKAKPSFGLEVAYWNIEHFPYSADLGFEFEKSKFRLYSEAQTGIAVTGLSAGPVLEFKRDSPVQLGMQGSFWVNYYLGFDCRFRFLKGSKSIAPGIYAKLPIGFGPDFDHHEGHDWDWD